jgi:hypothetical protein
MNDTIYFKAENNFNVVVFIVLPIIVFEVSDDKIVNYNNNNNEYLNNLNNNLVVLGNENKMKENKI